MGAGNNMPLLCVDTSVPHQQNTRDGVYGNAGIIKKAKRRHRGDKYNSVTLSLSGGPWALRWYSRAESLARTAKGHRAGEGRRRLEQQ